MPNSAWSGRLCAARQRSAQRCVRESLWRPSEVAGEGHAVLIDPAEVSQAEDLEAAGIGQDRSIPAHEAVQPAEPRDALMAGPQGEVVGVGQDDLDAGFVQVAGRQRLDRGLGADRHEDRGLHVPVRRLDLPQPGRTVGLQDLK
jgi:hypothetical protein